MTTANTIDPTKPILGYALKKRIGAGGYGEVWQAEAPGGLPKAVKIIYGYHDEKRAQTELKSLNRIRDVRHPFLLSLERIDVVDGQMIVISELADMCLKTRFQLCCESGLKGIPRKELLGYLRDAASALDFISEEFRLQHLDIKPENLLLVSGHVKVADFGLVKDIHDGTQSLMAGLTPAYAPPELFDGRPSIASDQYSLAILYQEMLTGIRPFDGCTAAQLAGQHLRERPNLKSLPRGDQAVVSRALSKNPEGRYPSCLTMVTELSEEKSVQAAPAPRSRKKLRDPRNPRRARRNNNSSATLTALTHRFAASTAEEKKLDAPEIDPKQALFRPTLFIGLGHTGTKVLRNIRKQLTQRFGDAEITPAIKLLTIDTDTQDLWKACRRGLDDGLTSEEVFETPLRRPEEYRTDARMHLSWLSRRWIYNIPKSLRTEGIRPLGRLALTTHLEPLAVRLRQVLSDLIEAESLQQTATALGLKESSQPRVVLVGSVSGGTCSGMAIDVAYVVRFILQQLGAEQQDVIGFFAHATNSQYRQSELATANTMAFLNELYHFSCVEEYPGDDSCGIPASMDGTTTFANTYLVHLGDNLDTAEFEDGVDALSQYLFLSTATACATYFDACRHEESETEGLPLRTMGISRSGSNLSHTTNVAANELCKNIVNHWTDTHYGEFEPGPLADKMLHVLGLLPQHLAKLTQDVMKSVISSPLATITQSLQNAIDTDDRSATAARLQAVAKQYFGPSPADEKPPVLVAAIQSISKQLISETSTRIHEELIQLIDTPGRRMAATLLVADELHAKLNSQIASLQSYEDSAEAKIQQQLQGVFDPEQLDFDNIPDFAKQLAAQQLKKFGLTSVRKILSAVAPACRAAKQTAESFRTEISTGRDYETAVDKDHVPSQAELFDRLILEKLRSQVPQMLPRVEQLLQLNFLDELDGLRSVINDPYQRDSFLTELEKAARMTILERLKEMPLVGMFGDEKLVERISLWMFNAATPTLLQCGGGTRWLHAYPINDKPSASLVEAFRNHYQGEPSLIPATVGEVVSCIEVENVPLDNLAMTLLQDRGDSLEYASRLHTRTDISWTGISSMR